MQGYIFTVTLSPYLLLMMHDIQRPLSADFFLVLRYITDSNDSKVSPSERLRNILLRDILTRAADNDDKSIQFVLNNLQRYIEMVHHEGYSADLMQCKST